MPPDVASQDGLVLLDGYSGQQGLDVAGELGEFFLAGFEDLGEYRAGAGPRWSAGARRVPRASKPVRR
ncbi:MULTISPECIES: hypothetical protein [Amycolatopsis]|uniref:hypothetical protein n=1 Tax=Amycolatopsis TaxID=1813 RepID=UPI001160737D|nr:MULTISPECIES: hypothetical protein [Amycolatopsis]